MNEAQLKAAASVLNYMNRAISDGLTFEGDVLCHSTGRTVKVARFEWALSGDEHEIRMTK